MVLASPSSMRLLPGARHFGRAGSAMRPSPSWRSRAFGAPCPLRTSSRWPKSIPHGGSSTRRSPIPAVSRRRCNRPPLPCHRCGRSRCSCPLMVDAQPPRAGAARRNGAAPDGVSLEWGGRIATPFARPSPRRPGGYGSRSKARIPADPVRLPSGVAVAGGFGMCHGAQHEVAKQRRPPYRSGRLSLTPGRAIRASGAARKASAGRGEGPALPRRYPRLGGLMRQSKAGSH